MEGIVTMNQRQRRIYQLATEVIRQKLTVKEGGGKNSVSEGCVITT